MDFYILWYGFITSISSALFFFTIWIILVKSPREMKTFRWMLANVMVTAYLETIFWSAAFATTIDLFPLPLFIPNGLGYILFEIPANYLFVVSVFLHGCILGSLAVALVYRYCVLLPLINIRLPQFVFNSIPVIPYSLGVTGGACALYCFLTEEETKRQFHQLKPNGTFPGGAVSYYPDRATYWAEAIVFGVVVAIFTAVFMVIHSHRILKRGSTSQKTKKQHKMAIQSLILQMSACSSCSMVPTFFYSIVIISETIKAHSKWVIPIALPYFSMKTVNGGLTCLITITPYRKFVLKKIGFNMTSMTKTVTLEASATKPTFSRKTRGQL